MSDDIGPGTRLFWSAKSGLRSGTVVRPGDFQTRLMRQVLIEVQKDSLAVTVPNTAATGRVMMELAWETVRLREFPHRPSRFDCLFLWPEASAARRFDSHREACELYDVEILECSRAFAADMNLISYFEASETLASMFERARRYWQAERKDEHGEILLEGTIRILGKIS